MPPPQPGTFSLPSSHKARLLATDPPKMPHHHHNHRQQTQNDEVGKREKKRKDLSQKIPKEIGDRRDDLRHFTEIIASLHHSASLISTRPDMNPMYNLRLYPIALERAAVLAQNVAVQKHSTNNLELAYEEERERVEEEWRRGREKVRERLLEGVEERRRRAREEKEGEGTSADSNMDSQSRPHITRKLRNKLGTSPPPTPLPSLAPEQNHHHNNQSTLLATTSNPLSLSIDELPSPFPLPLTSSAMQSSNAAQNTGGSGGPRRRGPKGGGAGGPDRVIGGLGKSLASLAAAKEMEVESDLSEIRRCGKRRRAAATAASGAIAGSAAVGVMA